MLGTAAGFAEQHRASGAALAPSSGAGGTRASLRGCTDLRAPREQLSRESGHQTNCSPQEKGRSWTDFLVINAFLTPLN